MLGAALVDVGGTLWPNTYPLTDVDHGERLAAVTAVVGDAAAEVIAVVTAAADEGGESAGSIDAIVDAALRAAGITFDGSTVRRVRQALAPRLGLLITPFPGAAELLSGIDAIGLRCVIVSNTVFRDADLYRRDFADLGWERWVDAVVTSVDVGCRKPDPRVFAAALATGGVPPERCVMIGDTEAADIVPAAALGMRTLRVAIEQPLPSSSSADALVDSLSAALDVVVGWAGSGQPA